MYVSTWIYDFYVIYICINMHFCVIYTLTYMYIHRRQNGGGGGGGAGRGAMTPSLIPKGGGGQECLWSPNKLTEKLHIQHIW